MARNKFLTMDQVFDAIRKERAIQDAKWGTLQEKNQELAGFLLVAQEKTQEAIDGWMNHRPNRQSALGELVQVAATAVAALQQYGLEGN